jgi:hypothetical protein
VGVTRPIIYLAVTGAYQAARLAVSPQGHGFTWHRLGGRTAGTPAITFVTVPPTAPLVGAVFVRGTGNACQHTVFGGPPTGVAPCWHSRGGNLISGITAATVPSGKTYLFALGPGSQLRQASGLWPTIHGWTRAQ